MIENGIRLLLVVEDPGIVLGLITASDILGEKPMQLVHQRGARHSEIAVGDVATLRETLEVMQMRDMLNARVGDIVATLRRTNRQHALAVEPLAGIPVTRCAACFSASQIARQLGVPVHVGDVARTFAEIEALLNQSSQRALRFASLVHEGNLGRRGKRRALRMRYREYREALRDPHAGQDILLIGVKPA